MIYGGVILANEKDVSFKFNKYGEPELLSLKDSVAQQIVNALFMVPGNLPSLPHIGVNIRQYLYKNEAEISSSDIEQKLKDACGVMMSSVVIKSVDVSVQLSSNKQAVFLVMVSLAFPKNMSDKDTTNKPNNDTVLGVSVVKDDNHVVKFNFAYAGD